MKEEGGVFMLRMWVKMGLFIGENSIESWSEARKTGTDQSSWQRRTPQRAERNKQ